MRFPVPLAVPLLFAACGNSAATPVPDGGASADGGVARCANYAPPTLATMLDAPALVEGSGLAASATQPGIFFALNDSGSAAEVFALRADGGPARKWAVSGARNVDWEDLARGPCTPGESASCLYLADVGDNGARRTDGVQVYVVAEPDAARPASEPLPLLRTVWLRYPDGPRDCETLLVHPTTGDLYLVEKPRRADGLPGRGVYKHPAGTPSTQAAPATLVRLGFIEPPADSDGTFTAGDIHPGGRRLALRTYTVVVEYRLPEGRPFDEIFTQTPVRLPRAEGSGGMELQGESLAYAADGRALYTSSEGSNPPLNRWECVDQ